MFSLSGCSNDSEFDETLEKAQRGDAEAQYNLGYMYATGEGVPEDHTEAVKWYRLVAEPYADDRICIYMISNPW